MKQNVLLLCVPRRRLLMGRSSAWRGVGGGPKPATHIHKAHSSIVSVSERFRCYPGQSGISAAQCMVMANAEAAAEAGGGGAVKINKTRSLSPSAGYRISALISESE
jgi:hypothetical protein